MMVGKGLGWSAAEGAMLTRIPSVVTERPPPHKIVVFVVFFVVVCYDVKRFHAPQSTKHSRHPSSVLQVCL